jgi:hypothetical protein
MLLALSWICMRLRIISEFAMRPLFIPGLSTLLPFASLVQSLTFFLGLLHLPCVLALRKQSARSAPRSSRTVRNLTLLSL